MSRSPYTEQRSERWEWRLLSLTDADLGRLDGVTDGRVEQNVFNNVRGGGSLTWNGLPEDEPDWDTVRVQAVYTARTRAGTVSWPLGVFIPKVPGGNYSSTGKSVTLELYDKLLLLEDANLQATYSVAAGTNVTDTVGSLLAVYAEGSNVSVQDSTATLRTTMTWEAGTTILKVVNELLQAINYFSVWVDGFGSFRVEQYREPGYRPVEWDFVDTTDEGIYLPEFGREQDRWGVPNKVILIGQSDGQTPELIGVYVNDDPTDPLSINTPDPATGVKGRGREVAVTETNVDAATQAIIDGLAKRRWQDMASPSATLTIQHALLPLDPNDAVTFTHGPSGISTRAVLQRYSINTTAGSLCSATYLEVAS